MTINILRRHKAVYVFAFVLVGAFNQARAGKNNISEGDTIDVKGTRIPAALGTPGPAPKINGPKVYGGRPENPFIYRVPVIGTRPIKFSITGLPQGLSFDIQSGFISGAVKFRGTYLVTVKEGNGSGSYQRTLKIIFGDKINLTRPWDGITGMPILSVCKH